MARLTEDAEELLAMLRETPLWRLNLLALQLQDIITSDIVTPDENLSFDGNYRQVALIVDAVRETLTLPLKRHDQLTKKLSATFGDGFQSLIFVDGREGLELQWSYSERERAQINELDDALTELMRSVG